MDPPPKVLNCCHRGAATGACNATNTYGTRSRRGFSSCVAGSEVQDESMISPVGCFGGAGSRTIGLGMDSLMLGHSSSVLDLVPCHRRRFLLDRSACWDQFPMPWCEAELNCAISIARPRSTGNQYIHVTQKVDLVAGGWHTIALTKKGECAGRC